MSHGMCPACTEEQNKIIENMLIQSDHDAYLTECSIGAISADEIPCMPSECKKEMADFTFWTVGQ